MLASLFACKVARAVTSRRRVWPATWRHLGRRTPARAGAAAARRLCVRRRSGDHGLAPVIARARGRPEGRWLRLLRVLFCVL